MKRAKKYLSNIVLLGVTFLMAGCNKEIEPVPAYEEGKEISDYKSDYETYFNYIELHDDNGNVYQCGDPFVFRWNGKYYLYPSVPGHNRGIPCWVSDNMIDWKFCSWVYGDGTVGSGGEETRGAYAPEVTYYNGYFYMCESPRGTGHYIFRSKSPEGPFELVSEQIGYGIDGSLYVENDKLYMLCATLGYTDGTLSCVQLNIGEDGKVTASNRTGFLGATLNGWTEGPGTFERDGYRYLTYTGNHVNSAGYRIGYSYIQENSLFGPLYTKSNNIILMNTGEDSTYEKIKGYNSTDKYEPLDSFRGFGHSSNILGPNLDSEFLAFHSANRTHFNNTPRSGSTMDRRYNLTQLFADHKNLTVNGQCDYDTPKPDRALFSTNNEEDYLGDNKEYKLSNKSSSNVFTSEMTFRLDENDSATLVVNYIDENHYTKIDVNKTSLKVIEVNNGETLLGESQVLVSDNKEAYHVLRIVNGINKSDIYYDLQKQISFGFTLGQGGKIGLRKDLVSGAIEFSNDAYGTGDFESVKNLNSTFPSMVYQKGEWRGYHFNGDKNKSIGLRQGEKESSELIGDETCLLLGRNDWVKYGVNAPKVGKYNLFLKVLKESVGSKLRLVIDDKDVHNLKIDNASFADNEAIMVNVGQFEIKEEGFHLMKILSDSDNLKFSQVSTLLSNDVDDFTDALDKDNETGFRLMGDVSYSEEGMLTNKENLENLLFFGDKADSNYEMSVDVKINSGAAGVVFRAKNYSYTLGVPTNMNSMQGYYLLLNSDGVAILDKYNYTAWTLGIETPKDKDGNNIIRQGKKINIRVKALNNQYQIYIDGVLVYDIGDLDDPFLDGYLGLYAKESEVCYSNLEYRKIKGE